MSASRILLVACAALAFSFAGCASRGGAPPSPAPPAAQPAPTATRPPDGAVDSLPRTGGPVTAPWDTAARSGATRRAHVYPQGESELGKRLVASLPDPGGLPPAEGPAAGAAVLAPAAPAPAPAPALPSAPATNSGCWEAQLIVTSDAARAERVRAEAAALLGVPVRVVSADGVHRVRAGGCLDPDAALRLVERARGEGWPEAFRVEAAR